MVHPGQCLQKKLDESGMTRKELAIRTAVTEKHICTVINGDRSISVAFARKLGYVFEDSNYWLKIQACYDEEQLRIQEENEISQEEIEILKPLHDFTTYIIERGYVHNDCGNSEKVIQLRDFLHISNLTLIPRISYNAAYRAQLASNIRVDPYVLFAWQCLCEKETESLVIDKSLDKKLLAASTDRIKSLMFGDIAIGIQSVQKLLANCGIAFQVVKNFRGAPVQGFIKETSTNKLILCLTIRGKRADCFWFTLFHEIGHILHGDHKTRFVDFDSVRGENEEFADRYAADALIPPGQYRQFIQSDDCTSWSNIENFAKEVNVQPFIVLGRLQNDGYLDWSEYSDQITRYRWA